ELILAERLDHVLRLLAHRAKLLFHRVALAGESRLERSLDLILLLVGEVEIRRPALGVVHAWMLARTFVEVILDRVDELAALIFVENVVQTPECDAVGGARLLDGLQQRVDLRLQESAIDFARRHLVGEGTLEREARRAYRLVPRVRLTTEL